MNYLRITKAYSVTGLPLTAISVLAMTLSQLMDVTPLSAVAASAVKVPWNDRYTSD